MSHTYVRHTVTAEPRCWQSLADDIKQAGATRIAAQGGSLYGVWRSQIGRPRDELTVITVWSDESPPTDALLSDTPNIREAYHEIMTPTLRPEMAKAPRRQGNYAFRSFETPAVHWDEFLDLCAAAWPGFESAYDSQVIGLWRFRGDEGDLRRSLLLTRRPNLAMWERSKIPDGVAEAEVRRKLEPPLRPLRFDLRLHDNPADRLGRTGHRTLDLN